MQIIQITKNVSLHIPDNISYEEKLIVKKLQRFFDKQVNGITLQLIADCTCDYFKCNVKDLDSTNKNRKLTMARYCICILYRHYNLNYSMYEVAKFLGRNSHAIVFYAKRKKIKLYDHLTVIEKLIDKTFVNIIS